MIPPRIHRLVIALVLAAMCLASVGSEPNDVKTKPIFVVDETQSKPWIRSRGTGTNTFGRGPIGPSYVAVLHIRRPSIDMPAGPEGILQVLQTPAAKSLSEQQRKFLSGSDALAWWGIDKIQNHDTVFVYAVSEEGARKTVQAYLEVATNEARAKRKEYEESIHEARTRLGEIEKELPEKREQARQADAAYKDIKKTRHVTLSDADDYEKAKASMLEMDKMLDVLEIELAGIREKLGAINEYRKTSQSMEDHMRRRKLPDGMLVKLEQMYVEQTIELKGAEARKQTALKIRGRDKSFVDAFSTWQKLDNAVNRLVGHRSLLVKRKQQSEARLSDPDKQPPVVYGNKVIIYPVETR